MTEPRDLLAALQESIDRARAAHPVHLPGDPVLTYPTGRDTGTRWLYGRPYHWLLIDGRHTLQPGPDPWET